MWSNPAKPCVVNLWRNPGENVNSAFLLFIRSLPFKHPHKLILLLHFFAISQREALTPNNFLSLSTSPLLCDHLHIKKGFVPISLCISPSHFEGISPVLSLLRNILVWGRVLTNPAGVQPLGVPILLLLPLPDLPAPTTRVTRGCLLTASNSFGAD